MGTRIRFIAACTIIMTAAAVSPVQALWIENGAEICGVFNTQEFVKTCSDGEGGAILVWRDYRNYNFDIYAQRVDPFGSALWTPGGVPVCIQAAHQPTHVIVSDNAGGVIVAWTDQRNGSQYDLYAQRIGPDGSPLWTVDGVPVNTNAATLGYPEIVTDNYNGAIISWTDLRNATDEIYVQRINGSGILAWTADGLNISTYSSNKTGHATAVDGFGGVYIVWADDRNGNWDIYSTRIRNGAISGPSDGLPICTATDTQFEPDVINDGYGGMIIAWHDSRTGDKDIYAQRVNNYSAPYWTSDGVPICTESGWQEYPKMVGAGEGGAIITWDDSRTPYSEIYAQKVNYLGIIQWNSGGVEICTAVSHKGPWDIVPDGEGGAIVGYANNRYGAGYDIYAQHLGPSGSLLWGTEGVLLCDALLDQTDPSMVSDGSGGAITAWRDSRKHGDVDVLAQRVERNGYWGYPAPIITGARDIPGDQGGQINLAWDASRLDIYPEDRISHYSIWRAMDETAAMAMLESGAVRFEETSDSPEPPAEAERAVIFDEVPGKAPVIRLGLLAGEPYYWQQAGTVYANDYIDHYAMNVFTLFDSTASSSEYFFFQVIAHESDPTNFWISNVDSARSVDNIAPCAPLSLAGEQSFVPEGLELTWSPNTELDFDCYNIYRMVDPALDPSPGNLLTTTCDTLLLDDGWTWDSGFCYKVTAVDIHGNESEYALFCSEQVTGDDPMPVPDATFLAQNYPNPFNPNTTIAFGLKTGGSVNLSVYDAAGRLVAVLIDESRPAGPYAAVWNGNTGNGSSGAGARAASGVYFYRLITKEFKETKKMILLR